MQKLISSILIFLFIFSASFLGANLAYAQTTEDVETEASQEIILFGIFEPYPTYLLEIDNEEFLIDYLGFFYSYPSDIFIPIWAYDECFNYAYQNNIDLRYCDSTVELVNSEYTGTSKDPYLEIEYNMGSAPTAPTSLETEGQTNPTGITDTTPEFTAIYNDLNSGDNAIYYQIQVATSSGYWDYPEWDSNKTSMATTTEGNRCGEISYGSPTPLSLDGSTYYWRIKFWDDEDLEGDWSTSTASLAMSDIPSEPTGLETEGQTNPASVTDTTPEFTAIYNNDEDEYATHYQIQVATSSSYWGATQWDSGKTLLTGSTTPSERSEEISYAGSSLSMGATYYWRIKFWDNTDAEGLWSDGADYFTMQPSGSSLYANCTTAQSGIANPTGLNCGAPVFSAIYESGTSQNAAKYQIQVNTQSDFAGTSLWDFGATTIGAIADNARSWDMAYRGDPLTFATTTYYWRIKFWDIEGTEGDWNTTTDTFGTANKNVLQDFHYTYDNVGNITQIVDSSDLNGAKTTVFTYDDLYRLTQASTTDAVSGGDYLRTYSYNAIGNITNKSDQGNYLYQGNTGNRYENPHAVTDVNGAGYSYDNNGNLTSNSTWTHSWDYRNRLTNSENGSTNVYYTYDHDVNRVTYSDGIATTTYPNQYYNISTTGTTTKHIFANGVLIATIEGNGTATNTYYIHTDHLTGSNVISDSTGSKEQLVDYYPFGEMRINEKESSFNEQRKFTGHEHDEDTELNYMVARYYDGNIGRFISVDPWEGDLTNPQTLNTPRTMENRILPQNSAGEKIRCQKTT
ncbi:hypothetical protein KAU19_00975 [Candidatus Parcubacteria bacterium]|nr:hypothetical protein [Candidatus Parcubacteria bacterium]